MVFNYMLLRPALVLFLILCMALISVVERAVSAATHFAKGSRTVRTAPTHS